MTDSILSQRARALVPTLRAAATEHDRTRALTPEIAAALVRDGFVAALAPRELGGHELSAPEYVELLEELARGDAATAWCVMTASTSTLLGAYLPRPSAQALWAGAPPFLAGVFAPSGQLAQGRLRGRWAYASGCRHAEHFALGAMDGARHVVCFVPAAAVQIVDTWNPLGLRGTGSHDVVVDVEVAPEWVTSLFDRAPWPAGALYRVPVFGLLATGISACALGIAQRALDHVAAGLGAAPSSAQLAGYAELIAERTAAAAALRAAAARATSLDQPLGAARGQLRAAAFHVARRCADVARGAFHLGGGAAARADSPASAAVRDLETLLTHRMIGDRVLPAAARAMLGLGEVAPDL